MTSRVADRRSVDPSEARRAAYIMSIIELEDTEMSDLVAIIYPSEAKAEDVRQRLFKLQKEYLITISDAVIAVKTEAGPIKLNQLVNTTAIGAASGTFWGLLIGVIFLNPILGVALGAASGAPRDLSQSFVAEHTPRKPTLRLCD